MGLGRVGQFVEAEGCHIAKLERLGGANERKESKWITEGSTESLGCCFHLLPWLRNPQRCPRISSASRIPERSRGQSCCWSPSRRCDKIPGGGDKLALFQQFQAISRRLQNCLCNQKFWNQAMLHRNHRSNRR